MLEYCKIILNKVSFDAKLFEKEFHKSIRFLNNSEKKVFLRWCKQKFKKKSYQPVFSQYKY